MRGDIFLRTSGLLLCATAFLASVATALPDLQSSDPAEWSSQQVYQILNNSPWSKAVKITLSSGGAGPLGNPSDGGNPNVNNAPMPSPMGGGAGRRGMGGSRASGTYGSGGNSSAGSGNSKTGPTEVTVQWQSALIVRMAAAKKAERPIDAASFPPLNDYVIALIGLPITAVGGRAASVDSDNTLSSDEEERIENNVKSSATLLRSGHEPLTPSKVELDQGSDGRMLIHFPKVDAIRATDKTVEFRLATGRAELHKKFQLKEMEYQGKLEL